jgi:hypothetical protein
VVVTVAAGVDAEVCVPVPVGLELVDAVKLLPVPVPVPVLLLLLPHPVRPTEITARRSRPESDRLMACGGYVDALECRASHPRR